MIFCISVDHVLFVFWLFVIMVIFCFGLRAGGRIWVLNAVVPGHCFITKTSLCMYTSYTPLLYSETGVDRDIHFFLIFVPKHRLWVLVRTTSVRRF